MAGRHTKCVFLKFQRLKLVIVEMRVGIGCQNDIVKNDCSVALHLEDQLERLKIEVADQFRLYAPLPRDLSGGPPDMTIASLLECADPYSGFRFTAA